jgi:hypothetical protein
VLVPVYESLGLKWDPDTLGALATYVPARWDDVAAMIVQEFPLSAVVVQGDESATA